MIRVLGSLILVAIGPALRAEDGPRPDEAVARGLRRIEQGAQNYTSNRACFSCHHQLALNVLSEARAQGFHVAGSTIFLQREFTRETFRSKIDRIAAGQGIPGANTMAAYALFTLEASGQEPDEVTDALVRFLTIRQAPDGSWPALADRPPSEGSSFTNAALALGALQAYGQTTRSKELRQAVSVAWDRGTKWVQSSRPGSTEDRAFYLRALVTIAASDEVRTEAIRTLRDRQRADGGWSQLEGSDSDAYATGIVLTALRAASVPGNDLAIRRGITFLLRTQQGNGGWLVVTRSKPVQAFFDNGDPGGKSQFISFAATNWALLALLQYRDRD